MKAFFLMLLVFSPASAERLWYPGESYGTTFESLKPPQKKEPDSWVAVIFQDEMGKQRTLWCRPDECGKAGAKLYSFTTKTTPVYGTTHSVGREPIDKVIGHTTEYSPSETGYYLKPSAGGFAIAKTGNDSFEALPVDPTKKTDDKPAPPPPPPPPPPRPVSPRKQLGQAHEAAKADDKAPAPVADRGRLDGAYDGSERGSDPELLVDASGMNTSGEPKDAAAAQPPKKKGLSISDPPAPAQDPDAPSLGQAKAEKEEQGPVLKKDAVWKGVAVGGAGGVVGFAIGAAIGGPFPGGLVGSLVGAAAGALLGLFVA